MPRHDPAAPVRLDLTAVVVAVTEEAPRVLLVRPVEPGPMDAPDTMGLPTGPFAPAEHRTLELGLHAVVKEQTALTLSYVEQLYTFGNQFRDPWELAGGPRRVSVAYLTLTREAPVAGTGSAEWHDWYALFPWEDWRDGRPAVIDDVIRPGLEAWIEQAPDPAIADQRRERVGIAFRFGAEGHDFVRVLNRYELLYEAGLVAEASRDAAAMAKARGDLVSAVLAPPPESRALGPALTGDDRRILASALGRLRGKLAWRPVVFELMPESFTLFQLQRVVEALTGSRLHKQNFRRTVMGADLVESTGRSEHTGRGRPAELYRFRREVLQERPIAGIGLPGSPRR